MKNTIQPELQHGHPIHTYLKETEFIHQLLEEISATDPAKEYQKFYNIFNQLGTIERRFERKENQLFPFLEEKGWTGPSRNMWSFHDTLREMLRIVRKNVEEGDYTSTPQNLELLKQNIHRLLNVEESVLFPNAMEILSNEDWIQMRKGEEEIGWMLNSPPLPYPNTQEYIHPSMDTQLRSDVSFSEGAQLYDQGYMSIEQVNLLFKTLPIDLTFVDEHDKVIFYNRGEERVFPRSAGIIGREVRFCHPPKSVDTVLQILETFKSGKKDEASFWITYKGRLIYIRYFAVRDADRKYKGVVEMSQDITDIKNIEGERRLLEWN